MEETQVSEELTTYEIDDVLQGYNNSNKLKDMYSDLREEVFKSEPVQTSRGLPLISIVPPNWRGGNYGWELYRIDDSHLAILEYFGTDKGYGYSFQIKSLSKVEESYLRKLRITLHSPEPEIQKNIEDIIARYPRYSKK